MNNPKCPDCRNEELEYQIDTNVGYSGGEGQLLEEGFYKCPKCRNEYDLEDIDQQ